jgi:hypothetical protein
MLSFGNGLLASLVEVDVWCWSLRGVPRLGRGFSLAPCRAAFTEIILARTANAISH